MHRAFDGDSLSTQAGGLIVGEKVAILVNNGSRRVRRRNPSLQAKAIQGRNCAV